jgi:hypothetical protein
MLKHKQYLIVSLLLVASLLFPAFVSAAQLNQAGLRLGRLSPSATTGNDLLVTFKLNTTPTSVAQIAITFPSGFNITAGSPAVSTTGFPNTPASIAVPPGSLTATATSNGVNLGGTIVVAGLTSASLNNTSLYGFIIASGTIQNPSSGGAQYNTAVISRNSGGTPIDTTTTPVYITSSSPSDQVTVNASVAPNFTFSLSATSDTVPQVDPSAIQTSSPGVTMTVSTNSRLGYTAYVKSANGALTSATAASSIPTGTFDGTPDTLAPVGTISKYLFVPSTGTACSTCTGSLTYDGEYNGIGANTGGAFNSTNFASFVSRNGYTNADAVLLRERVAVTATIPTANDYTDTLTIVAAVNY